MKGDLIYIVFLEGGTYESDDMVDVFSTVLDAQRFIDDQPHKEWYYISEWRVK